MMKGDGGLIFVNGDGGLMAMLAMVSIECGVNVVADNVRLS